MSILLFISTDSQEVSVSAVSKFHEFTDGVSLALCCIPTV